MSIDDEQDQKLVYSTRTGEVILLNNTTINSIKDGNFSSLEESMIDKLIFSEIIVPEFEDKLETILSEFEISKSDNDSLGMVITPSANCQLGYNYCGQTHSKVNITEDLSLEIFNHIKNKLEKEISNPTKIIRFNRNHIFYDLKNMIIDNSDKENLMLKIM